VAANFPAEIAGPLRTLADHTIDVSSVFTGILVPGTTVGDRTAASLRRRLFGAATLADLPDNPRFIFTATNLHSGSLWRFSKLYMRDWQVGRVSKPKVPLAQVVAASAAFPVSSTSPIRMMPVTLVTTRRLLAVPTLAVNDARVHFDKAMAEPSCVAVSW